MFGNIKMSFSDSSTHPCCRRKMGLAFLASFCFISVIFIHAGESVKDENSAHAKISKIIENEKTLLKVKISDEEARNALLYLVQKMKITRSDFSKIAEQGKLISTGLKLIVNQKEKPDCIYETLKMQKNGIDRLTWNYYVKNYSDTEKIKKLEAMIPDSMEKVIASGIAEFKKQLSTWMLYRKIISDYDSRFPGDRRMSEIEKIQKWWSFSIKKYHLGESEQEQIYQILTASNAIQNEDFNLLIDFFSFADRRELQEK